MRRLEEYGTAQAQKIYKRHGALPDNVFGVSFANLNVLAKEIKRDHALARALWQSKNYDARNLAVKIAEPKKMDLDELREWGRDVTNYMHAGSLGSLASDSNHYATAIAEWTGSDDEYLINAGYSVLGSALKNNPDCLSDDQVREYLTKIEREIHQTELGTLQYELVSDIDRNLQTELDRGGQTGRAANRQGRG